MILIMFLRQALINAVYGVNDILLVDIEPPPNLREMCHFIANDFHRAALEGLTQALLEVSCFENGHLRLFM